MILHRPHHCRENSGTTQCNWFYYSNDSNRITTSPATSSYRCIDRSIDNHDFTSHRLDTCHPSHHVIWNATTTTTTCFARRPLYCYQQCYYYYATQQLCYNTFTSCNILSIARSRCNINGDDEPPLPACSRQWCCSCGSTK